MKLLTIAATSALIGVVSLASPGAAFASVNEALSEEHGLGEADARDQVVAVFAAVKHELEAGRDVTIRNFGKFYLQSRDARTGRNPKTGEALEIPARKYPKFKSSQTLKNALNK